MVSAAMVLARSASASCARSGQVRNALHLTLAGKVSDPHGMPLCAAKFATTRMGARQQPGMRSNARGSVGHAPHESTQYERSTFAAPITDPPCWWVWALELDDRGMGWCFALDAHMPFALETGCMSRSDDAPDHEADGSGHREVRCHACRAVLAMQDASKLSIRRGGLQADVRGTRVQVTLTCYRCAEQTVVWLYPLRDFVEPGSP